MADADNKPIIFLSFANDREDNVGYLRNLPEEARRLRAALKPAEQAGLCDVEAHANCTAGDIFKVFQDPKFRNRIAIFHYGGHADGYQLLLESPEGKAAAADAGGLAAFLAQQQGLQLVFLNGCSTQQQTQELHDANVAVVISTSRSIDDKVATDFADRFYQGLAGGTTLRKAYSEASGAIKTTRGGDLRALYFADADTPEDHRDQSGFPWNLYPREGSENADQWNLPEAVNDPLFGLPLLPEQDLPESPYRHIYRFRREDAEVFFGRGHQIRKLYGLLTAGTQPIILFYGQSGVGKSSLLDAGLMPRLEQSCEVRYLRRRPGGLLDTLQLAFLPEASHVPIETAWLAKEEQLKKPLIVFLDQVEEFYTQPIKDLPDELDHLLRVVKATFSDPKCRPKGKLVLSFRKEWLAELEAQLVAYELPRAKVSLEPLDRDGIIEVVRGEEQQSFQVHGGRVNHVLFGPDGEMVASGGDDRRAVITRAEDGQTVADFKHNDAVKRVRFTPDGNYVLAACFKSFRESREVPAVYAKLWSLRGDLAVTEFVHARSVKGGFLKGARLLLDGRIVMTEDEYTTKLWDIWSGQLISEIRHVESREQHSFSRSISADGTRYLIGRLHPNYATSLSNLAELHHETGQYAKADPLYRRSPEMMER